MTLPNLRIDLLADHPAHLPELAQLLYEEIGRHWVPGASVERTIERLATHLNIDKLPIAMVARIGDHAVGMACLRQTDGIRPGVTPWLGSLVVDPKYRGAKIGEALIEAIKTQARMLSYSTLYLLAFDPPIPDWYAKLGWQRIGDDELLGHPVSVMSIEI